MLAGLPLRVERPGTESVAREERTRAGGEFPEGGGPRKVETTEAETSVRATALPMMPAREMTCVLTFSMSRFLREFGSDLGGGEV